MSKLYEIYMLCGGRVATDSRTIVGGEMFFALKGEKFDGNRYAMTAIEAGANFVVADDAKLEGVDSRIIVVEDSLKALQELAREHRERLGLRVVGLTGTNGKTTTKELIIAALSAKYCVGATTGNLNNHIGVPLTLLSFDSDTEIGVVEMGANHVGEIAQLCEIACPYLGLITNIGRAHLEGFGSVEGVIQAKGELYDYLQREQRVALYNVDDATLCSMVAARPELRSIGYSGSSGIGVAMSLFGVYNSINGAAALAVSEYFGVERVEAVERIAGWRSSNNRSEIIEHTAKGNRVVVDCYNANPSSMEVALKEFLGGDSERKKVVILGAMKELGEYSEMEHLRVVELSRGADVLYFIGEEYEGMVATFYHSVEELMAVIDVRHSDVLVKGSRGNRLERIIPNL